MAKYRARENYAQIYAGDKQGYNLGLDGSLYAREESVPRVFALPRIGTQGKSLGDDSASTDISAHASPATLKVTLGYSTGPGAQVTASFATAGLTTGALIAAALETAINNALAAAGQDGRVWVEFNGAFPDNYTVWHQSTGDEATVVIANGTSNNIADDLKLGVANGGTETAGTDDQDFLLYTTGGITYSQPVESNLHRSGRFHTGIIRKKKITEFDFDTYVNMSGTAGASLDTAVQLMLELLLGTKTVNSGVSIDFTQGRRGKYCSFVRVSTIFGEYVNGGYVRQASLAFPGDGPATVKYQGKAAETTIAGLSQLNGAIVASTAAILNAGEAERYEAGCYVMIVDIDGRTILYGVDGTLTVTAVNTSTHTLTLSGAVTVPDNAYVVPWDPGAVQQSGRDAVFTDLVGTMKLNATDAAVDVTNIELSLNNDPNDFDNRFGADANKGYADGNRMTAELSVTFDLSNETFGKVVQTRSFGGFSPELTLGDPATGRALVITAPKWIPSVPPIEVPENGTTPVTLTGVLYQSAPGSRDPVRLRYQ